MMNVLIGRVFGQNLTNNIWVIHIGMLYVGMLYAVPLHGEVLRVEQWIKVPHWSLA